MINISKDKNWEEVRKQLQVLKSQGRLAASQVLKQIGLKGEQIIVNHLANQDLGWKDLSESYKAIKERKFKKRAARVRKSKRKQPVQKILIDTSTLFQSITSFAKDKKVHVGVPAGDKYADGGKSLAYVAAVHEYGVASRGIPARPLFKPSRDELKEWCKDNYWLANTFISEIKHKADNV